MKFVASNQPHRAFENVYAIFTKPFENQVETIKYKIWNNERGTNTEWSEMVRRMALTAVSKRRKLND